MNLWVAKQFRSLAVLTSMVCSPHARHLPRITRQSLPVPDRPANERELDAARKPAEVMAFYGVKRGDKVADLWAGRGYYTAILSEIVGPEGVVYTVNPNSRDEINQRWKAPKFANVKVADGPFDKIALPQDALSGFCPDPSQLP